jgi:methylthioribose-1-phosphate isomerase
VALRFDGGLEDGRLLLLDQTRLPLEEVFLERRRAEEVVADLRRLAVRGAPLVGLAGAYALVLAARECLEGDTGSPRRYFEDLGTRAEEIASARPTAVNLRGAVTGCLRAAWTRKGGPVAVARGLLEAARELEAREVESSHAIARHATAWLGEKRRFLTHCNTGALAAPGLGTALAPIYLLHHRGAAVEVWVGETRPLLQGWRLTAYELARAEVPHRVLAEGAAAGLLRSGAVDAVLVGADRICRNGDFANKVGTYGLAVLAREHGVPLVVAAPTSTLDAATPAGDRIPIEERPDDGGTYLLATAGRPVGAYAPAFDWTPARLVTALVTEHGVVESPDEVRLAPWMADAGLQGGSGGGR